MVEHDISDYYLNYVTKPHAKDPRKKVGIFASGDVVTGAKTVVEAVRLSKIVADEIDAYVRCAVGCNCEDPEHCEC